MDTTITLLLAVCNLCEAARCSTHFFDFLVRPQCTGRYPTHNCEILKDLSCSGLLGFMSRFRLVHLIY